MSRPTGITISTKRGEQVGHMTWRFGFGLHRVWFGDHRSGWSGINFHIYFFWKDWRFCIICWRNPLRADPEPVRTLRQQIDETHGDRWARYDAKMEAQVEEERAILELDTKIVNEGIRRRYPPPDTQYPPAGDDEN